MLILGLVSLLLAYVTANEETIFTIQDIRSLSQIYELLQQPLRNVIPDELGLFSNLRSLVLSEESLIGEVPIDELCKLTRLVELKLRGNMLTGSLPLKAGCNTQLETLDLSSNDFSGGIPESLCNLTKLVGIDLSHNMLIGNLPVKPGCLVQLQTVDLSNNDFSGQLPLSLGAWTQLLTFKVSHNRFFGNVFDLRMLNSLYYLELDNNRFTGLMEMLPHLEYIVLNLAENP